MDIKDFLIDPLELYDFLKSRNQDQLFHANTLATSCTFLKEKGLLSRGAVELSGLFQTSQKSDDLDKEFDIWDHIFLDSVDICNRSGIPNHYGPILFELSVELLKDQSIDSVMITRYNPTKWDNVQPDRRYLSKYTYKEENIHGSFDQMITLQCKTGKMPIPSYLQCVKIDGPNIGVFKAFDIDPYSYCRGALRYAIDPKTYNFEWAKRMCGPSLIQRYEELGVEEINKRFKAAAK